MADINLIPISKLLMDVQNPRFKDEQKNQDAAVQSIVISQPRKMIALARDILAYGLSPFEAFLVIPTDHTNKKYLVLEGNRRLAAIRIMENPSVVVNLLNTTQQKQLIKLSSEYNEAPIISVNCATLDDKLNARHWIELRHEGEKEGAGIVPWGTEEKRRFKELYGERDITLQVLDYLVDHEVISSEDASKVPITNLWRIVVMPYAREKFGYEVVNNYFQPVGDEKKLANYFKRIVTDLYTGVVRTGKIYHKKDRVKYIDDLITEFEAAKPTKTETKESEDPQSNTATTSHQTTAKEDSQRADSERTESDSQTSGQNNAQKTNGQEGNSGDSGQAKPTASKSTQSRETQSEKNRKYLVPGKFKVKISSRRINDIYIELKSINIGPFTNAVAVLFRVFLELSIDDYISQYQSDFKKKPDDLSYKLFYKMEDVGNHLLSRGMINKQQMDAVKKAVVRDSFLDFSISTLHAYVHNPHFSPSPGDLIGAWDKLEGFIKALWER